ncbi:hypothetical protein [Actinomyces sp. MRS3W]|uniref:hypothetical protein n=1 Tax=Actinomyces sp. MRS3W TaxID=2800796 RepID=UPI0028FDA749|nr:hypothetical protein [Actinomyces sp. MRS3W]MDU0348453.1 hypothetical protein [Actinomyces sp. MRS3W]MDU0348458.1 hypothetical protein [Actinomyces sp. MRS3W]
MSSLSPAPTTPRSEHCPTGMYGPRGWTVKSGVWHELADCRDELRSTIIPGQFGFAPAGLITDDGRPVDDYTPFHDLGPGTARRLLEILPESQLADRQNLAPTLGALLRACVRARGRIRLSGYGIGPQRHDERVTVEGLWIEDPDLIDYLVDCEIADPDEEERFWEEVAERYCLDAEASPDEIKLLRRHWTHGPLGTWLWWD